MSNSSNYDADFRRKAVDAFVSTAEQMPMASKSFIGESVAQDFGIARSTLMGWVTAAGKMPMPTWGEIHRLRAEKQKLELEVARLRRQLGQVEG